MPPEFIYTVFPRGHRLAGQSAWRVGNLYLPVISGGEGPVATLEPSPMLVAARARRTAVVADIEAMEKGPAGEIRTEPLTVEETTKYKELRASFSNLDEQIVEMEADEVRKAEAARVAAAVEPPRDADGDVIVKTERHRDPLTYEDPLKVLPGTTGFGQSYMRDLSTIVCNSVRADAGHMWGGLDAAYARLERHAKEMSVDAKEKTPHGQRVARIIQENRLTTTEMRKQADAVLQGQEVRVAPNLTSGTGGDLVPPGFLIDQFVGVQRAGRVVANRVTSRPLPGGLQSLTIPKILVGTKTGQQGAPGAPIASRDLTTSFTTKSIVTIAGQADVDQQWLDFSPVNTDDLIFSDLAADLDQQVDLEVIAAILALPQSTTVNLRSSAFLPTYTNASMLYGAVAGYWNALASGMSNIATTRFQEGATEIWTAPRRWYFALATTIDTTNRPVLVPAANAPYNAAASQIQADPVAGFAGISPLGLPVYLDANMPITVNGTTDLTTGTQDATIVLKADDQLLFEGSPRMRAMVEPLSSTLQVRFQLWNYNIYFPDRYEGGVAILRGAGGAAPSF